MGRSKGQFRPKINFIVAKNKSLKSIGTRYAIVVNCKLSLLNEVAYQVAIMILVMITHQPQVTTIQ